MIDARNDIRFQDNPLVIGQPNIVFYAGIPLKVAKGYLGHYCVIDHKPKTLSRAQINSLKHCLSK
jgi:GAF domain-containing protein